MPRFSIIIPCQNAEATLKATLDALRAQTCKSWEAICVDGGSTDATRALVVAAAASDSRISLATNPGKSPGEARNFGAARLARGEIVAFCDADDIWVKTKLASLDKAMADPDVDGAYARVAFFRNQADRVGETSRIAKGPLGIEQLLGENPVYTMSNIALRRELFIETGGFNPRITQSGDLEWLIRLCGEGANVIGIDEVLVWYRTNPTGRAYDLNALRAGRNNVLTSARRYGAQPNARADAQHLRYLAHRALRLDSPGFSAFRLSVAGIVLSPAAFLFPLRRGSATALAALAAPAIPRPLRRMLFCRKFFKPDFSNDTYCSIQLGLRAWFQGFGNDAVRPVGRSCTEIDGQRDRHRRSLRLSSCRDVSPIAATWAYKTCIPAATHLWSCHAEPVPSFCRMQRAHA